MAEFLPFGTRIEGQLLDDEAYELHTDFNITLFERTHVNEVLYVS